MRDGRPGGLKRDDGGREGVRCSIKRNRGKKLSLHLVIIKIKGLKAFFFRRKPIQKERPKTLTKAAYLSTCIVLRLGSLRLLLFQSIRLLTYFKRRNGCSYKVVHTHAENALLLLLILFTICNNIFRHNQRLVYIEWFLNTSIL